ncbi:MAG TPA: histidine phosphatase family protein [Planctomycetota bacterium]|nr:histidine phosphatase family protein [Planctomycetota bacterium]
MPTTLTLIRHGETEWNKNSRWQGQLDIPLSELGLEQARRLAARLKEQRARFDAIYSSDLGRALKTAETISAVTGPAPLTLKELREIDVGTWSGLYTHELETRFPEDYRRMKAGEDIKRGGAESMADVVVRVRKFLGTVVERHSQQHVAIVTHNGVIRAALMLMKNLTVEQGRELGLMKNCSITRAEFHAGRWDVKCMNDAEHLNGIVSEGTQSL